MTQEFIKGLIIGGGVMLLILMLFKDLFLKRIFSSAVPVIQDDETGEVMELEDFVHVLRERAREDSIRNYKLLILLKATINMILKVHNLDKGLEEALIKKSKEVDKHLSEFEEIFKGLGINISEIIDKSTFLEDEKIF